MPASMSSEHFLAGATQPASIACQSTSQVHDKLAISDVPPPASRYARCSAWSVVSAHIHGRQNVGPRRLREPGPDSAELELLIHAAAAAPDHGLLVPWRFLLVPQDKRSLLGDAFAAALIERDPLADRASVEQARDKAFRAPMLLLAVARFGSTERNIPARERLVSLGCAIQNLLLAAEAMGYSSGLVSGQALSSNPLRSLCRIQADEEATCFISIGTAQERRPARKRPQLTEIFETL